MADNDDNDEYQFTELDSFDNELTDNTELNSNNSKPAGQAGETQKKDIKRNALIAVGLIIFAMIMYQFIGWMFFRKSSTILPKEEFVSTPVEQIAHSQPEVVQPQPVQTVVPEGVSVLKQKVASIESSQQNIQTEVSSMNQQVLNLNHSVSTLGEQITKLNQVISDLSNQVGRQSEEINVLMERTKPKPVKRVIRPRPVVQQTTYYINAVIPGRAWLIGSNGSTLTIREGTKIAGYGVVKLIDAMEGRVLTSSGRVIRFSQEDS